MIVRFDSPRLRVLRALCCMGLGLIAPMNGFAAAPTGATLTPSVVTENDPINKLVGTLAAIDPDVGDSHTFSLVDGTGGEENNGFTVSGNQVRLRYGVVKADGNFVDFETEPLIFHILVRVRDAAGGSYDKAFTISMLDDRTEDVDGDGLTEAQEEDLHGTSDVNPDSDGDGFGDRIEVLNGSSPSNANSLPNYPLVGWGSNLAKELLAPVDAGFLRISTGQYHTLGLKPSGSVSAWAGFNTYGQITVPGGLTQVVAVAAGGDNWLLGSAHSLALKSDGTVTAWGCNEEGQCNVPPTLSGVFDVAAGRTHSLALKSDGTVVAWGANLHGETAVPVGLSGVVDIAAAGFFSLALKSDGSVVSWGRYFDDNEWQVMRTPVGLSDIVAVSAGIYHALALRSDGKVFCWGYNGDGQCSVPTGLTNVTAVAGGGFHSLALKSDGSVVGWGSNKSGQITIPNGALSQVKRISAGLQHSQALRETPTSPSITSAAGISSSPGNPVSHQIVVANATPVQFAAIGLPAGLSLNSQSGLISGTITGPIRNTIYLRVDTNQGQLEQTVWINVFNGDSPTAIQASPVSVVENAPTDAVVTSLTAVDPDIGDSHTFELIDGPGSTDNAYFRIQGNQLIAAKRIDRDYEQSPQPLSIRLRVRDASLNPFEAIMTLQFLDDRTEDADGDGLTEIQEEDFYGTSDLIVDLDGDGFGDGFEMRNGTSPINASIYPTGNILVAWGNNSYNETAIPSALGEVVALASGWRHNLALTADGTVTAWGWNDNGQTTVPPGLSGVVAVSAGDYHSMVLKSDGTVISWGGNADGQATVPSNLADVVAISAGSYHSAALKRNGTVVVWGDNGFQQLNMPPGLDHVVAISAGGYHTLALKDDGTVVAWGRDWLGAVSVPQGLGNVVGVAAGGFHSLALLSNGTVVAWGDDENGQSLVPHGLSGVVDVKAGWKHSLAVKADGTVVSWGSNLYGQVTTPLEAIQVQAIAAGSFHNLVIRRSSGFPKILPGSTIRGWPGQVISQPISLQGATSLGQFSAMGLPAGLAIDSLTGVVGGTVTTGQIRSARIMASTDKGILDRIVWMDTQNGSPPTAISFTPASQQNGQALLLENSPSGTIVGTLAATDPDAGDAHTFVVNVNSGSPDPYCLVAPGGQLTVQSSAGVDYEKGGILTVRVRATDLGENSIEQTFTIQLLDDRTEDADGDGLSEATEEDVFFTSDLQFDDLTSADADSDGIPTLIEYAFNLNLQSPDAGKLLGGAGSTSGLPIYKMIVDPQGYRRLRMEYLRRVGAGLIYAPQFSNGMGAGTWNPPTSAVQVTPVNASWERCVIDDYEFTPSPARRFGRIGVSR